MEDGSRQSSRRIGVLPSKSPSANMREFRGEPPQENGEPLAITTKQKYEQYLRDYLIPVLGNKLMGGITPKDIQAWADTMPLGAAGEGGAIKRKVWELLRAIFNHAVETPLDMDGTTLLTKSPVLIEVSKPCSDVAYGNVSAEELETLYQAMTPRFAPVIYLIGIMGMRPARSQRSSVKISCLLTISLAASSTSPKPLSLYACLIPRRVADIEISSLDARKPV